MMIMMMMAIIILVATIIIIIVVVSVASKVEHVGCVGWEEGDEADGGGVGIGQNDVVLVVVGIGGSD